MTKITLTSPSKIIYEDGKARRKQAKTMLLAILYGMSAKTAGERMGRTSEEGQELMDNFYKRFKNVKKLQDDSLAMLKSKGYVTDWTGRRRHLPEIALDSYEVRYEDPNFNSNFNPFLNCPDREADDETLSYWKALLRAKIADYSAFRGERLQGDPLKDGELPNKAYRALASEAFKGLPDKDDRRLGVSRPKELSPKVAIIANTGRKAQARRECLNARIQGGAASLTKRAMVSIADDPQMKAWGARLIIQVHDEVLLIVPELYADQAEKRLAELMIGAAKPEIQVPMKVDTYNLRRWYADEMAAVLQTDYAELIKKGKASNDALAEICAEHSDLPAAAIKDCIVNNTDEILF